LVTVKVRVERRTDEWMNTKRVTFDENWLKCLDTETVKCRRTVEHDVFAFDDFFEDCPDFWNTIFDEFVCTANETIRLVPKSTEAIKKTMTGSPEVLAELDVYFLHQVILQKHLNISLEDQAKYTYLKYFREIDEALAGLKKVPGQVLILQNPCSIDQVFDVALGGEVMPQKSTDFYPKLLTGLLFLPL
jgi:hypothetical protein